MVKKKQAANSIPKPRKGNVATEATPSVAIPEFIPKMDRPIPSAPIVDIPSGQPPAQVLRVHLIRWLAFVSHEISNIKDL